MRPHLGLGLGFALITAQSLFSATKTWDGGGADSNWLTGANWDADTAPVANDILVFAGAVQTGPVNTYTAGTNFNGLTFAAGAAPFTLTGNQFNLGGNITNSSSSEQIVRASMFTSGNRTIDVGAAGMTIERLYSSSSNRTITKNGTGTLRVTRTGGSASGGGDFISYTVNAGTLVLAATYGDGPANNVTVANGGRLEFDPNFITIPANAWAGQVNNTITIQRGGVWDLKGTGGVDEDYTYGNNRFQTLTGEASNGTIPAALITNSDSGNPASISVRRRAAGVQTYAGIIEGNIGIDFAYGGAGAGQVNVLSGNNTYTGHTQVIDETLVINGDQSAATGDLLVRAAASPRLGGTGTIGAANVSIGGQLAPGNITASGTAGEAVGTLTFTGAVSFVTSNTTWLSTTPSTAANGNIKLNVNLNKWTGAVAGVDYDKFVAKSLSIGTTSTNKLTIALIAGTGNGFNDTAQSFTLATTTDGVSGLTADNWQVTTSGLVAAGTWSLAAGNGGKDLVLSYAPVAPSASKTWDGGGADNNLSTAANWTGDVAPVAPESIGFAGSTRLNPVIDTNANTTLNATGDTTAGSATVVVTDATGIAVGQGVSGVGISAGTTVTAIAGTTLTLSATSTATATGVALTFTTFAYNQVNGVLFSPSAGSFNLSGNGINLGDATATTVRITNDGTALQTISAPVFLRNDVNQVWTRSGDLALTGAVSATAARTLTFVGAGTTTLGGVNDNAFLVVAPSEGTVVLAKASSATAHAAYRLSMGTSVLGTVRLAGTGGDQIADSQALTIDSGVLDLNGTNETIGSLAGGANANPAQGNIVNNAVGTPSTLTINQTANTTFGGNLKDGASPLSVTLAGNAANEFQVTGNNTFTGGTTITGAYVRIGSATSGLGSGPITLADTTGGRTLYIANITYTLPNNLIVAAGTTNSLDYSFAGTLTYTGSLTGTGHLNLGNGFSPRHLFQGVTSGFAGMLDVLAGGGGYTNTLSLRETTGGLPLAKVLLRATSDGSVVLNWFPSGTLDGTIELGELATDFTTYASTAAVPVTVSNGVANTRVTWKIGGLGTSSIYEGVITNGVGSSALEKVGAGTLTLTGLNSYTGDTTVTAGVLSASQAWLADNAVVRIAAGATLNLTHGATDTVAAFVIGGVAQPAGVWGALGSGAAHETAAITGTGRLSVTYSAAAAPALTATAGDATVGLSWTAATGATSYTVKRATSAAGPYTVLNAAVTATSYTDNAVTNGTTYYYTVTANQVVLVSNTVTATPHVTPASAYAAWAAAKGLTAGVNDGPTQDPDGDGVSNVLEFVFGGDPLTGSTAILPTQAIVGSDLVISFKRSDESEAQVSGLAVQYGSNLTTWTTVAVGAGTSGPDGNGVVVTVAENGAAADDVSVAIPLSQGSSGRLFGRVQATYTLP